jgi:hypothetical protein
MNNEEGEILGNSREEINILGRQSSIVDSNKNN